MIKLKWKFAALLAATCASFAGATALFADSPRVQHVFIISYDQGNPELIRTNDLPTLNGMASDAAHTWSAYTILPSITLPAHTSMLTGLGPQAHQVLWNSYLPEKGPMKVPTIFSIAKQHGLVTAMFVGKEKFKHLELPGSLDAFVWPRPDNNAVAVAKAFAAQVATLKPNLCFIHFHDPDTVGHKFGAYAPEKIQALKDCDAALQIIKDAIAAAGLTDSSVIIITADHGSHDATNKEGKKIGAHDAGIAEDVKIPWIVWGQGVKQNFTITALVVQYDTAATALWLLGIPLPENLWGRPVTSAFE